MADRRFFHNRGPFSLANIQEWTQAELRCGTPDKMMADVAPLDRAQADEISFFDNSKYLDQFTASAAGACFIRPKYTERAPKNMALLVTEDPYRCYAIVAQHFYPFTAPNEGIAPTATIAPSAKIGHDVTLGAGVVIGANVIIGNGCIIGPNAVIQDGVTIGEFTRIGATSTVSHAIIGSYGIIHRGVHIGQDGFGFAMGRNGHAKVPQLGRVLIEDHVEIGAGTCIDRGTGPDTIIGAGTKIDNLVQIGHNVQIGRNVIIVAQVGISGSTRIGDGAVIGGQAGIAGHIKVGAGVRLAARTGVTSDLEAGKAYGGTPAVPINDWHRQVIAINRLTKRKQPLDNES